MCHSWLFLNNKTPAEQGKGNVERAPASRKSCLRLSPGEVCANTSKQAVRRSILRSCRIELLAHSMEIGGCHLSA
jgi:hypothetical protein